METTVINLDLSKYLLNEKLLVSMPKVSELKKELRYATSFLNAHKLYQSAKW